MTVGCKRDMVAITFGKVDCRVIYLFIYLCVCLFVCLFWGVLVLVLVCLFCLVCFVLFASLLVIIQGIFKELIPELV